MSNIECNFVAENLSAFVDQELDESISYSIKEHLCNCLDCRRKFSKLLKLQRILKGYFGGENAGDAVTDLAGALASVEVKS